MDHKRSNTRIHVAQRPSPKEVPTIQVMVLPVSLEDHRNIEMSHALFFLFVDLWKWKARTMSQVTGHSTAGLTV